jgi:hypothetical protein
MSLNKSEFRLKGTKERGGEWENWRGGEGEKR